MALDVSEHRELVERVAISPAQIALAEAAEKLSAAARCFANEDGELWWTFISSARNIRQTLGVPRDREDDWGSK